jgi:hypothetical protein
MALSLALKPHDSGLVWLFFLLAGPSWRKRALQTLLILVILSLPSMLWIAHVSPHWMQEAHANMLAFTGPGAITDPGAAGMAGRNMDSLVELQSAVSIFWESPHVYNAITYTICGALFLAWAFVTIRVGPSQAKAWLALAVVAPLSMLPVYHLQHDAKILMLAVPGCALLWAEGGKVGRLAVFFTVAAIGINGDIFSLVRILLTQHFVVPHANWPSQMFTVVLTRPAPLILLGMAAFYLWAYVRHRAISAAPSSVSEELNAPTP